jgi:asparagine synthase (glutamine-hydrolysing)
MCGITGIISPKGIKGSDLILMSSALCHRGPDGYGYMLYSDQDSIRVWLNEDPPSLDLNHVIVGFAHRRLSIIDLSPMSLQPMIDDCGNYCVTYNGEIYNYLELRSELELLGYSFKTTGDTEVILRAYQAWGTNCMQRFNGMWAFVLLDAKKQCVILSRDRFGIKPLYYMIQNNSIYFSSEIKGFLAISSYSPEPNEKTVVKYLLTEILDDTEQTFFTGIFQFPAGHWAKVLLNTDSLSINPQPYWTFPHVSYQGTEQDAIREFQELFLDSLRIHIQSEVPVGTCLSGGLDSSSLVCGSTLLRRNYELPNFSHAAFGYCSSDEQYSERKYMDIVAEATHTNMHYVEVTPAQFRVCLPQIIRCQEEPFGSASIATQWFVFQRAKKEGMKVMLDGQGADEILGGYHTYFTTIALNLIAKQKLLSYFSLRTQYEKEIGKFPLSYQRFSSAILYYLLPYPFKDVFQLLLRHLRGLKRIGQKMKESLLLRPELIKRYSINAQHVLFSHSLSEELQHEVRYTSLPRLLGYEDKNSMAHSIESRVPFLDYRLVEFLFTLPDQWKINGVLTKYILREAMKGILPERVRTRKDKIGFKAASNFTFQFVREDCSSLIENQTEFEKLWFRKENVSEILRGYDQTKYYEFLLWRILNLKLWLRQHWS